jgi:hypothetical protein
VDHVVGQVGFRERGEVADVAEEDCQRPLAPGRFAVLGLGDRGVLGVVDQPADGYGTADARLTGEADVRLETLEVSRFSDSLRGRTFSRPPRIMTRQVEQRALPPQSWTCGTPCFREICRSVRPGSSSSTVVPSW